MRLEPVGPSPAEPPAIGFATSGVGLLASYGHDDLGRVTTITRGNRVSTAYGYDGISRLTSLSHTMSGGNVQNQTYGLTYSSASQLRKVTASNSGYRWSGAATTLRAYGVNGQNQLTTSGGAQIAYDARGNLSSDSVTNYSYDVRNLLTSASGGASATLNNDPEGRLQSLTSGGAVTQFVYAGPNVAAEVNASGTILRRYVPGLAEDRPVVWYEGAGLTDRRWLLEDHQGSVVAVTNGTGGALAINSYDDYGAPGSGNLGRYQYTGQLWLPEVGLYDYKARDYSPTLGRFMQTDPVGYKDGLNWYEYAHDDPIDRTDPSGLEAPCVSAGQDCLSRPSAQQEANWQANQKIVGPYEFVASLFLPGGFEVKGVAATGRVFWSGGQVAMRAAMDWTAVHGGTTLEQTFTGKTLTALTNVFGFKNTEGLWKAASAAFARGAKGEVNVFLGPNIRPGSVWKGPFGKGWEYNCRTPCNNR